MGLFSNNNNYNTNYRKRPFDSYKSMVEKLDEETKQRLDRQRQKGMIIIVIFVFLLVIILAVTGIGIDKNRSASGNVFADKENVLIECFGDSLTEGFTVFENGGSGIVETSYPQELERELAALFAGDGNQYKFRNLEVKNYGQSGSSLLEDSYKRLSGKADIVIIQYLANNFLNHEDYSGYLENNAETIAQMGSKVFLLNYPYQEGVPMKDKLEQANNYIASAADAMSASLIDIHQYFAGQEEYSPEELFCEDQLHLTETGYKLMGDYIAQEIHLYYSAMH